MDISNALKEYRKIKYAEFKKVTTEVEGHWITRILPQGLHELGEYGATVYLKRYGNGIKEPKIINFAIKAEREDCQEMAWGFWRKAYELSTIPECNGYLRIRLPSKNVKERTMRPIKILFLASNPEDTARLRIDWEIRNIKETLRQAQYRDRFDIQQEWAVRPKDLQKYFLQHSPDIVHFSGHGTTTRELVLEDDGGKKRIVPPETLGRLFQVHGAGVRCVVLNACYSLKQANIIANYVDCVVGMTQSIIDGSAIAFTTAFYQSLAYGKDVENAFESGRLEIELNNPHIEDQYKPRLVANRINPKSIVLITE